MTIKEKIKKTLKGNAGVPILLGEPGKGKTAVLQEYALEMKMQYIDLRLSQKDETDVGGLPHVFVEEFDGKKLHTFDVAIPRWALRANTKPTLVVVEELNRAPLAVRNAALQIFQERRIGEDFNFNDNVYFAATGNLGEEDGTEIEEFDSALWNRLVVINYDLTVDEWIENFAAKNVKPEIVACLKANPEVFYVPRKNEKEKAFATPRSWTHLSKMIVSNHGMDASPDKWIGDVQELGAMYVGISITRFIKFLQDTMAININDVIERYPEIKDQLKKMGRDKVSELLGSLAQMQIFKMSEKKLNNIQAFLLDIDSDETIGFINEYVLEKMDDIEEIKSNQKLINFMKPFNKLLQKIDAVTK